MRYIATLTIALITIGTSSSSLAFGADPAKKAERMEQAKAKMQERFTAADADHDGKLTKEEAAKMPRIQKNFDQIDSGKTGYVTLDQVRTFAAGKMQERQAAKQQ